MTMRYKYQIGQQVRLTRTSGIFSKDAIAYVTDRQVSQGTPYHCLNKKQDGDSGYTWWVKEADLTGTSGLGVTTLEGVIL